MKNKHTLTAIAMLLIFTYVVHARKLASLPEVQRPFKIGIKNNKLFITDHSVLLHMYSMKDFSYKLLSRKGEGPGESRNTQNMWLYKDKIFTYGNIKGMYFSNDGDFLEEFKILLPALYSVCPLGNNFITKNGSRTVKKGHFAMEICLYKVNKEKDFKYQKILYYFDCEVGKTNGRINAEIIKHYYDFIIEDDKVFVGDTSRGFYVEIFDSEGNEAGKIRLYIDRVKVPESLKDEAMKRLEKSPRISEFKAYYHPHFPEYYPEFYRFDAEDGKVYFLTYKKINDRREVIVTDYHGKILRRRSVPWSDDYSVHTNFAIVDDKYYYIKENEDSEEWELHVEDIK